jgi:hypothetical protein
VGWCCAHSQPWAAMEKVPAIRQCVQQGELLCIPLSHMAFPIHENSIPKVKGIYCIYRCIKTVLTLYRYMYRCMRYRSVTNTQIQVLAKQHSN